jgi:transcriptional activator SPT7
VVKISTSKQPTPNVSTVKVSRRDVPFPETPAIVRTPSGMSEFWKLDHDESWSGVSSGLTSLGLAASLREKAPLVEEEDEMEVDQSTSSVAEELFGDDDSEVGEKRKLYVLRLSFSS